MNKYKALEEEWLKIPMEYTFECLYGLGSVDRARFLHVVGRRDSRRAVLRFSLLVATFVASVVATVVAGWWWMFFFLLVAFIYFGQVLVSPGYAWFTTTKNIWHIHDKYVVLSNGKRIPFSHKAASEYAAGVIKTSPELQVELEKLLTKLDVILAEQGFTTDRWDDESYNALVSVAEIYDACQKNQP